MWWKTATTNKLLLRLNQPVLISQQQIIQIGNLVLYNPALVRISECRPAGLQFHGFRYGLNILILTQSLADIGNLLMLQQAQAAGIGNQRITGYAGLAMIGFTETSVKPPSMIMALPPALTGVSPFLTLTGTWPLMI